MEILTLLNANIRYKKGSMISVLILTFLIMICITSVISVNYSVGQRANDAHEEVGTGDLTAVIWEGAYTNEMEKKIEENSNVDHVASVKAITQSLEINNKSFGGATYFQPYDEANNTYKVYDKEGGSIVENPEELKEGEIYVPISFSNIFDCKIGDIANFSTKDTLHTFVIKGFIEEPLMGAEMIGTKFALMNQKDFESLYEMRSTNIDETTNNDGSILSYYFLSIYQDMDSDLSYSEFKKSINSDTNIIDYSVNTIDQDQSKTYTLILVQIVSGIMIAFSLLLFIVLIIVLGHTITVGIEQNYVNLGVLKAIGYNKGKLRLLYILEYLIAEIIGGVFGVLFSIPVIHQLNSIFISLTGLLSKEEVIYHLCIPVFIMLILISIIYVYLKTRRIGAISPVLAINGGKKKGSYKQGLGIPVEGKHIGVKLALRQLTSNKKQYVSALIIVTILVYFLTAVTSLNSFSNKETIESSFGEVYSDLSVMYVKDDDTSIDQELQKQVENDISQISEIVNSFQHARKNFTLNEEEYLGRYYSDTSIVSSYIKGKAPKGDNEIAVTQSVADDLGVKLGDTVTVGYEENVSDFKIVGIYQCIADLGKVFDIPVDGVKKLIPDLHMNSFEYMLKDSDKTADIKDILEDKYGDQIEVRDINEGVSFVDTVMGAVKLINLVIYFISIAFCLVVTIIVCGKVFYQEQMDYGIYQSVGFTTRMLRIQFAIRFGILAFIGGIFGVTINVIFNNSMMGILLKNMGTPNYHTEYTVAFIVVPILIVTLSFYIFSYMISRKIRRIKMRNLVIE